jgi:hypothetical protein
LQGIWEYSRIVNERGKVNETQIIRGLTHLVYRSSASLRLLVDKVIQVQAGSSMLLLLHVFDGVGLSCLSVILNTIAARMLALIIRNMVILLMKFEEILTIKPFMSVPRATFLIADICGGLMHL